MLYLARGSPDASSHLQAGAAIFADLVRPSEIVTRVLSVIRGELVPPQV
jgi:hypothetical protein